MVEAKPVGTVRERLLQAANELFYAEGVHTVGIDRIIERAGVAKASLYGTFGSKDELVRAYLTQRHLLVRERIERKVATQTEPAAKILAVFDSLAERVAAGNYLGCPFIRACTEGPPGPNTAREAAAMHREWRRGLFKSLAADLDVPNSDHIAVLMMLIYEGASMAAAVDDNPALVHAAREAAERLLKSLPEK